VLNVYPRYNINTEYEDFARAKLMLHHSWRVLNDLLYDDINEEQKSTFAEVYENCRHFHNHDKDGLDDDQETFNFDDASQDPDDAHAHAQDIDASFAELAAHLPDASGAFVEEPDQLGRRDIDDVDWHPRIAHEEIVGNPDFWKEAKQGMNDDFGVDFNGRYRDLEAKQKLVYDVVTNHFNDALLAMENPSQSQF
jgi:hypothetical protein